jgi:hypothetical protein
LKVSVVLSTSHTAVAMGISGSAILLLLVLSGAISSGAIDDMSGTD